MKNQTEQERHDIAVFRHEVISPLLHAKPGTVHRKAKEQAQQQWEIPGSKRTRVAVTTIHDWLLLYNRGGFEALKPKSRNDRDRPRRLEPDTIEALIAIKKENPEMSVRMVIKEAYRRGTVPESIKLPRATIHRMFDREGLMVRTADTTVHDRRRFAYESAGDMWQSDVMHGPKVRDERGHARKTYLIALLDDATRLVPYAEFAFSESAVAFLPVFGQAIERRGIPKRLYVDNGAAYRSKQLATICARLGVALIHARPYSPAGKGKIERWLLTVRMQLLSTVTDEDRSSLEAFNGRFRSWVEGEYHRSPHQGLSGFTPLDQWALSADQVRYPAPGLDLQDMFLFEVQRKVRKDRTVQLSNRLYEVAAVLVGEIVTLRYDPAKPLRPMKVVHAGKPAGEATLVDVHANARVKRQQPLSYRSLAERHSDQEV